jgi:hypothetical protein
MATNKTLLDRAGPAFMPTEVTRNSRTSLIPT